MKTLETFDHSQTQVKVTFTLVNLKSCLFCFVSDCVLFEKGYIKSCLIFESVLVDWFDSEDSAN